MDNIGSYFVEGKFNPNLLKDELLQEYKIIYVVEIGFFLYNKYWLCINEEIIKKICQDKLGNKARAYMIDEVVKLLKSKVIIPVDFINRNKERIVLQNGTLDISDWSRPKFYEDKFYPEDYSTIQLNCNYISNAECPNFDNFLKTTFDNDMERILLAGEILGYCLTPSTTLQKAFVFYGEGSNGKSVLLNVIEKLLTRKNIASVSMSDLNKHFSRATLQGKLVNISSEQEKDVMDTDNLKKIISGDLIDAQHKFKPQFEFNPTCKMVFAMNKLPVTRDKSHGYYRRFIMIPFDRIFAEHEQDKNLSNKLKNELDGILQFALAGLKRLAINGDFTHSSKAEQLLNQYKYDNNPVEQFFEEYVEIDENSEVSVQKLFNLYMSFCHDNNIRPLSSSNFGKEVQKKYRDIVEKKYLTMTTHDITDITSLSVIKKRHYVYTGLKLIS